MDGEELKKEGEEGAESTGAAEETTAAEGEGKRTKAQASSLTSHQRNNKKALPGAFLHAGCPHYSCRRRNSMIVLSNGSI